MHTSLQYNLGKLPVFSYQIRRILFLFPFFCFVFDFCDTDMEQEHNLSYHSVCHSCMRRDSGINKVIWTFKLRSFYWLELKKKPAVFTDATLPTV